MDIVSIDHVTVRFGSLTAVDDVSFKVPQGSSFAIVGESGCGKTTLGRVITGLLRPQKGIVEVKAAAGMVFQDPNSSLDPLYNVERILDEAFYLIEIRDQRERRAGMVEMLKAVGLEEGILPRYPHEFSGGQRQRIAIARALLANPKILVLDEVTSSLDVLVQRQVLLLLKDLKTKFGLTYVFISHNLRAVRDFADKMIVMRQGRVEEQGTVGELLQSPRGAYTRSLIKAALTYRD